MTEGAFRADDAFDVIVLGSGGAGCAAALAAAGLGLSVCLLERACVFGGGTADSLGTVWIPANSLAAAAGLADTLDAALTYAGYVAGGQGIDANVEAYVRNAARVLDRFIDLGLGFRLALPLPDYFSPHAPGSCADGRRMVEPVPMTRAALGEHGERIRRSVHNVPGVSWSETVAWGGFARRATWPAQEIAERQRQGLLGCGEALIGHFLAALIARGATLRREVDVGRLVFEGGRVVGVALAGGGLIGARRGIVLATGGYEGNAALVRDFEGLPDWMNPFAPMNRGDGLILATELGAQIARIGVNNSLFVGCAVPGRQDAFYSVGLRGLPYPGAIAINQRGERFCDETQFQDVVMALQHYDRGARRHDNLPAYMIFDDAFRARYPVVDALPGAPAHAAIPRADSLAALAAAIDVDPAGLAATVTRFNADVRSGHDSVFGRGRSSFSRNNSGDPDRPGNPQLAPLDTPPFYALRLKVGGVCSAGLLTDARARVLHARGHAIAGLYACGNTAAPTFLGTGYQGGASIGAGMVFAHLAAEDAAAERP